MSLPILPYAPRVDIAATTSPSNFVTLKCTGPNAIRVHNKTTGWGSVYITDDASQATAGSPPGFPGFSAIGNGVPIPPNSYIDYRFPVNMQLFASAWLDAGTGTISLQPVSI